MLIEDAGHVRPIGERDIVGHVNSSLLGQTTVRPPFYDAASAQAQIERRRKSMISNKLLAYGRTFARARYKRVPDILRLLVKRPTILAGVCVYETALLASGRVDNHLKVLAMIKASSLIGCPF